MINDDTLSNSWPHSFDIRHAQAEINKMSSAEKKETSEIFAEIWPTLTTGEKLKMGKELKKAVMSNSLQRIKLHSEPEKGSDNHVYYDIG